VGDTYFPYQSFNNNVNKTRIREVSLNITNAPQSFDASFDYIQSAAVPFEFSPSLGLVLCGGLFSVNKLRKRLKIQNSQYELTDVTQ
jgi:hypothetical protein